MARVLVVDDDPDIRTILVDRLAARGHDLLEATDGLKALEPLEPDDVDVGDSFGIPSDITQQHDAPVLAAWWD